MVRTYRKLQPHPKQSPWERNKCQALPAKLAPMRSAVSRTTLMYDIRVVLRSWLHFVTKGIIKVICDMESSPIKAYAISLVPWKRSF